MLQLNLSAGRWGVVLLALATAVTTNAAVEDLDGTVTAEVQELRQGTVVNRERAFEDLNDSTSVLPLEVSIEMLPASGSTAFTGVVSAARLADPREATQPNPAEFGLTAAAFSQSSDTSYTAHAAGTQTRDIVFTNQEIGSPDGTELEVRSFFFVDAVLVLWADAGRTSLEGASAEIALNVQHRQGDEDSGKTVLAAGLNFSGNADGTAVLAAAGSLEAGNVVQLDLSALVPQLGRLQVVYLPQAAIPYTYSAVVGEGLRLDASISANIANSGFTGAVVLVGVDLERLGAIIEQLTGANPGGMLGPLLNVQKSANLPTKPLVADTAGESIRIVRPAGLLGLACGPVGLELGGMAVGLSGLSLIQRRRRAWDLRIV